MSWQAYVDTNLVGTGKVTTAAIVGLQGGVWASSPGYKISKEEETKLIKLVSSPETALAEGVRLHGEKFIAVQTTDRSIYGKKQADGVVIVKTKQAILVGEYVAPLQGPETIPVVEGLADYLISLGY